MKFQINGTIYKTIFENAEMLLGYEEANPAEKRYVRKDNPNLVILPVKMEKKLERYKDL